MKTAYTVVNRIVVIATLTVLRTQALAADDTVLPEEKKGAVIGGVVGAVVGGPWGAGIGALLGGSWIGKTVGNGRIQRALVADIADMNAALQDQDQEATTLRQEVARLRASLLQAKSAASFANTAPEIPIQFRTAESTIAEHYTQPLDELAATIARRPTARVMLAGFADRRGDEVFNLKLSEQRVLAVKRFLMYRGVAESQIETTAFGETRPVAEEQTAENNFFDRRVVMQFSVSPATAGLVVQGNPPVIFEPNPSH
jgi:sortase system peptidoglycan-associated protein